ncbi:MAG: carboxymuconolactone decarboxylase family protein [Candidatus Eremiobacteraeota bacterium]|nr:carboxymuconolactone decarboxylase family protein [Candidatus Eremiobacteraeota bacterium]
MSEMFEALAARPQIARTLARHIASFEEGELSARTRELCALMVSWLNACQNCLDAHAEIAQRLGVDRATLDELGDFARSERFSPAERAALAAAVALTREPRALPLPVRAELDAHYSPGAVVEIVATIGLYNYLTRANNALS